MSTRRRKEPIHKIFQVCSQLIPDPTWKDFLDQCSYGYLPSGVKMSNGNIISTRKKNSFTVSIPTDPDQALVVLINVFKNKLGIKSVKEKKSENIIFKDKVDASVYESWADVKTKTGRVSLISNFVENLGDQHCMTIDEKVKTIALLEICVNSAILGKNEIDVSGGRITGIKHFYFDPYSREAFYSGSMTVTNFPLIPTPIYTDIVKIVNLETKFMNVLKEHSDKMNDKCIH